MALVAFFGVEVDLDRGVVFSWSEEEEACEHQGEDSESDQEVDEHGGHRWSTLDLKGPWTSGACRHEPRPRVHR